VLLRLKPGPAEAMFNITTAPNAVAADWHGRTTVTHIRLRGDIDAACRRLSGILANFDLQKAAEPPFVVPQWARPFVEPDGEQAVTSFLEAVHPIDGGRPATKPSFDQFVQVYRAIDLQYKLIPFCKNYIAACQQRTPAYGTDYPGYDREAALLKEMTFCPNDGVKFKALGGYGRFAPVADVSFFVERAKNRTKDCHNPNVLLCSTLSGIGAMAGRFPGVTDRQSALDRKAILATIPALIEVLDKEGRNNGACKRARGSLETIIEKTGAAEALEGYLHNFKAPHCNSQWMKDYTAKFHQASLDWLKARTGQDLGFDFDAWQAWFQENRQSLYYEPDQGKFVVDAEAAAAFRKRLAEAAR